MSSCEASAKLLVQSYRLNNHHEHLAGPDLSGIPDSIEQLVRTNDPRSQIGGSAVSAMKKYKLSCAIYLPL